MSIPQNKITDLASLLRVREAYRLEGRTVVWTNGCFDLIHAGHIRSLPQPGNWAMS